MNTTNLNATIGRLALALTAFCLALAAAAPTAAQQGAPPGQKYAFLVAVRQYDATELTSLKYTEDDIVALSKVLQAQGYKPSNVVLMTQTLGATDIRRLPLAKNVKKELDLVLGGLKANDSIMVAFSGHGVQFKGEQDTYFCPLDAKLTERETLLAMKSVYDSLAASAAREKFLFVDACRNDPRVEGKKAAQEVELEAVGKPQALTPPNGVVAFFSCSPGQISWEDADLKHGIFLHYVAEALSGKADSNGDQMVRLGEFEDYVATEVYRHVRETRGADQKPQRVGQSDGAVTMVKLERPADPRLVPFHKITNTVGMSFVYIPAGTFVMGAPESQPGRDPDETEHEVRITKPYYMGTYEVTLADFGRFVKETRYKPESERLGGGRGYLVTTKELTPKVDRQFSHEVTGFKQSVKSPVVNVSWNDAVAYCAWISQKEQKTFRLPTEAEWEYACRAGSTTRFSCGDDAESLLSFANVVDVAYNTMLRQQSPNALNGNDGAPFTREVGAYRANAWGLFDMHGNVAEWCQDWHGTYPTGTAIDPKGPASGKWRVARGGSWAHQASWASSSHRANVTPESRELWYGFRVVREAP